MPPRDRPRILCVDDEPRLLEGVQLTLGRHFAVTVAPDGPSGLRALRTQGPFAVVISDMRMPGMNGAEFLAVVRKEAPQTVRMLLTGQADVETAIEAVNEGEIFRFLTKPIPAERLHRMLADAIEHHRLVTAERELLEQTLMGSLQALSDVLALANPEAFGRGTRVRQVVTRLAQHRELTPRWDVEAAAILSQIGYVALSAETVTRIQSGQPLSTDEQRAVTRVPAVTEALLAHIPRLEKVRAILGNVDRPFAAAAAEPGKPEPATDVLERAQLLRLALDFDRLEGQGFTTEDAVRVLRQRTGRYDPALLEALERLGGHDPEADTLQRLSLHAIRPGMTLAEDLRMRSGMMVAPRGYLVTEAFVERVRNYQSGAIVEPVSCIVPGKREKAA